MDVIQVVRLKKYYHVAKKQPGVWGSIKDLFHRRIKTVKAVDDISFTITEGELVGLIGPNGAGKTTTLKCLSGLLYPTAGFVSVLGFTPFEKKPQFLRQIAFVMGQKNQLWWDLPPTETFALNKLIYEIPDDQYQQTLNELVELLEVKKILNIQVRKLSLGQRMKCELIASLLHRPKVLFLDEPTIGLDVVMQKKIRDFIKLYNQKYKATIILTSHYMGDVKELAKRVLIIDKGKLVFDGQLKEIVDRFADHKVISLVLNNSVDKTTLAKFGRVKEYNPPHFKLLVKRDKVSQIAAKLLAKLSVNDLSIEEPPIEDIIRELFTSQDYA